MQELQTLSSSGSTQLAKPTQTEDQIRAFYASALTKQVALRQVAVGAIAVVGLALLAPFAMAAVQGGFALAVAGALTGGAVLCWKLIPYMMLKIENKVQLMIMQEQNAQLARLKTEARTNPIEQAQNDYMRRQAQYQQFKEAMGQIGGQISKLQNQLDQTKRDRPSYDLTQETAALEKMKAFYNARMDRLKLASQKLREFKDKIDEAQSKWEFQLAANQAIRAMNATDQDSKINEILTQVSFDSVQQEFDTVFARLDVDTAEMQSQDKLDFGGIALHSPSAKAGA